MMTYLRRVHCFTILFVMATVAESGSPSYANGESNDVYHMKDNGLMGRTTMKKSKPMTRRKFVGNAAAALASTGIACVLARVGKASDPLRNDSENGIIFYPEMHKRGVMALPSGKAQEKVDLTNWTYSTDKWRWAHMNADKVFQSRDLSAHSAPTWHLPRKMIDPEVLKAASISWSKDGKTSEMITFEDWLRRDEIDSLVAMIDGHIVAEVYTGRMTPTNRHHDWCAAKSLMTTIAAPFLADKTIDVDADVTRYAPELRKTGFNGAQVRHLLDMTSGVKCKEWITAAEFAELTPTEQKGWDFGSSEFRKAHNMYATNSRYAGLWSKLPSEDPAAGFYDYLLSLTEQDRPHGQKFEYRDSNCMAFQLILERASGTSYVDLLSKLVRDIGFEDGITATMDPAGTPVGAFGLSMRPRDWARWGQMVCNRGEVANGKEIAGIRPLVDDILSNPGADRVQAAGIYSPTPNLGYRSLFWTAAREHNKNPMMKAVGYWNNTIQIDPARKSVVAINGTFWESDPEKVRAGESVNHWVLSSFDFSDRVLPELVK